jgi:hypothetical protein
MPIPVSSTAIMTRPSICPAESVTLPPDDVYLNALSSRMSITRRMALASAVVQWFEAAAEIVPGNHPGSPREVIDGREAAYLGHHDVEYDGVEFAVAGEFLPLASIRGAGDGMPFFAQAAPQQLEHACFVFDCQQSHSVLPRCKCRNSNPAVLSHAIEEHLKNE